MGFPRPGANKNEIGPAGLNKINGASNACDKNAPHDENVTMPSIFSFFSINFISSVASNIVSEHIVVKLLLNNLSIS